jgi:metal-responsive CopG/Arc/MetJ family transcriptional regulator
MGYVMAASPLVTIRFPPKMLERVEQYGQDRCVGRPEAIRQLVDKGLACASKEPPREDRPE